MNRRTWNKTGFTLIEILVAVTILGAGILGVVAAFSMSLRVASASARMADAVRIAQREMELKVAQSAESLRDDRGAEGPYAWKFSVSRASEGLMRARVTVTWLDRGRPQSFKLSRVFLPRAIERNEEG